MRTLDFVAKELGRRRTKSIAGVLCILLGISIFVAAQTTNKALYDKAKEQLLRFGANIIIQPTDEPFDINTTSPQSNAMLPEVYADKIHNIEHSGMLVAVSPKLYQRFEVNDINLLVAGVTAGERMAKPWWMIDKRVVAEEFPEGNKVLLGHYASAHLGPVSQLTLQGETFTVSGILDETGSTDDHMAFVPLHILQRLTNKQKIVNIIEVSTSCIACSDMNIYSIAEEIDKVLPDDATVVPVKQIAEAQIGTLTKIEDFIRIIYLVVLGLGGFLMMNYMSSSVSERRREIGILLAIGMNAHKIYIFFILKAFVLGLVGGAAGYMLGTLIAVFAGPQLAGTSISPIIELLPFSLIIATGLCLVATILPARKAARLDPVVALQEV